MQSALSVLLKRRCSVRPLNPVHLPRPQSLRDKAGRLEAAVAALRSQLVQATLDGEDAARRAREAEAERDVAQATVGGVGPAVGSGVTGLRVMTKVLLPRCGCCRFNLLSGSLPARC